MTNVPGFVPKPYLIWTFPGTFIVILRKVVCCVIFFLISRWQIGIMKNQNLKRHFSKNYDKRPRNRSTTIPNRKLSWDVCHNSSKSGNPLLFFLRESWSQIRRFFGEHFSAKKISAEFFFGGYFSDGRWTAVGRPPDAGRTAIWRRLDGRPTAVRRQSDDRPIKNNEI